MTKIPSVEELFGKDPLRSRSFENQIRKALTADRTALLTELRETIQAIDFYGWNEPTQSKIKEKVQAHLDELIKSNSL